MTIYTILGFNWGEEQHYRHRGRGSRLKGLVTCTRDASRCLVAGAGTYLPAVSVCVTESPWCEHRQRLPGGGGSVSEYQFSRPPRHLCCVNSYPCQVRLISELIGGLQHRQSCKVSATQPSWGHVSKVKKTI